MGLLLEETAMKLVTTRLSQGLFHRLRQLFVSTPASELEQVLATAGNTAELDFIERNWAQAHRRRFG
jgi:hypothetical protein